MDRDQQVGISLAQHQHALAHTYVNILRAGHRNLRTALFECLAQHMRQVEIHVLLLDTCNTHSALVGTAVTCVDSYVQTAQRSLRSSLNADNQRVTLIAHRVTPMSIVAQGDDHAEDILLDLLIVDTLDCILGLGILSQPRGVCHSTKDINHNTCGIHLVECCEGQTLRERNTHYVSCLAATNAPRAYERLRGQSACGLHLNARLGNICGAILRQTNLILIAYLANSFEQNALGDVTDLRATQAVGTQTIVQVRQFAHGAQHHGSVGIDHLDCLLHRVGRCALLALDAELQRLGQHFAPLLSGDHTLINAFSDLGQFATAYDRHLATRCANYTQSHALTSGNSLDVSRHSVALEQIDTLSRSLGGLLNELDIECLLGTTVLRYGNDRHGILALFEHSLSSKTTRCIYGELLAIDRQRCIGIGNTRDRVACGCGLGALATTNFKTLSRSRGNSHRRSTH